MKIIDIDKAHPTRGKTAGGAADIRAPRQLDELTRIAMDAPVDDVALEEIEEAIRSGEYKLDWRGLADRLLEGGAAIEILGGS